MNPICIVLEVGHDVWGRPIRLVKETVSGKKSYTVHAMASNQRDEDTCVHGLTEQVIFAMAEAVRSAAAHS